MAFMKVISENLPAEELIASNLDSWRQFIDNT